MPTEPLTGSRYPDANASPNVPQDIQNAVWDLSDNTIPRFATSAERDTAYASWVTGGGVMQAGLTCFLISPGCYERYNGTTWKRLSLLTSTTGWTPDTYAGTNNYTLGTLVVDPGIGPFNVHVEASAFVTTTGSVDASLRIQTPGPVQKAIDYITSTKATPSPSCWIASPTGASITLTLNLEVLAGTVTTYSSGTHSYMQALVVPA